MAEAELASDILAMLCTQAQANKSIDVVHKRYEDEEGPVSKKAAVFEQAMGHAADIYPPDELHGTCWTRQHMFCSLAVTFSHIIDPIDNLRGTSLTPTQLLNTAKVRSLSNTISSDFDSYNAPIDRPNGP